MLTFVFLCQLSFAIAEHTQQKVKRIYMYGLCNKNCGFVLTVHENTQKYSVLDANFTSEHVMFSALTLWQTCDIFDKTVSYPWRRQLWSTRARAPSTSNNFIFSSL